jgi:hypothetical protein
VLGHEVKGFEEFERTIHEALSSTSPEFDGVPFSVTNDFSHPRLVSLATRAERSTRKRCPARELPVGQR